MIKTDELVKLKGSTMFFPRIIVTKDEMDGLFQYFQVERSWIKQVTINFEDFPDITRAICPCGEKAKLYAQCVSYWSQFPDAVIDDIQRFADGSIDLVDLVVKYGIGYKKCRAFMKDVLHAAGCEFDVDHYWKQHKKHAQKNTTVALYGVMHTAMRPEVQEKRIATNREKYGADNPMQIPEIKEKLRARIRQEHGVDYTFMKRTSIPAWQARLFECLMSDPAWQDALRAACEAADAPLKPSLFSDVLPVSRRDFVISELENTHVESLIRLWNQSTGSVMKFPENALFQLPFAFSKAWLKHYKGLGILEVPDCYFEKNSSIYERNMEHFLDTLGVDYLRNHKKALDGLELDFYFPSQQTAIELNPNVSHNSNRYALTPTRSMFDSRKDPSYHYIKYKKAKEAGITLIQLFGNDLEPSVFSHITSKRVKSLLCGYDTIYYARKTELLELKSEADRKRARSFLNAHHSQGSSRASSYWAFQKDGEWLGVASFSQHKEPCAMELKRLCFKPGVQVVGGLSRLVAHFFRANMEVDALYSYSDNSMGNGSAYRSAGAKFVKETGPALKFLSPKDGHDSYSWQIATSWGADKGVVGVDAEQKGLKKPKTQEEIDAYIELSLSHRSDDGTGYDRIYTPGSKLWKFTRKG